eukprot:TRINITY_DN1352_c0_g1_i2.p1 TRINITY_DN1352_c0_g1~~TRINITY_DN1352_c0_g1_i2.p1  ORF type:complete len:142 (-),score=17.57 TRINITY_DN1352_c0_g1_i2:56-481(-)
MLDVFVVFFLIFVKQSFTRVLDKNVANKKKEIHQTIQRLKKDSEQYNSPSTFSTYAKIQREIIKKQKEMDALGEASKSRFQTVLWWILQVTPLLIAFFWWNDVLYISPCAYPDCYSVKIHIIGWSFICTSTSNLLLDITGY